jgi:hypothetical protein
MLDVRQLNNAYEVCTELRIPRPPDVSTSVEGRRIIFFPVAALYSSALSSSRNTPHCVSPSATFKAPLWNGTSRAATRSPLGTL